MIKIQNVTLWQIPQVFLIHKMATYIAAAKTLFRIFSLHNYGGGKKLF